MCLLYIISRIKDANISVPVGYKISFDMNLIKLNAVYILKKTHRLEKIVVFE